MDDFLANYVLVVDDSVSEVSLLSRTIQIYIYLLYLLNYWYTYSLYARTMIFFNWSDLIVYLNITSVPQTQSGRLQTVTNPWRTHLIVA